MKYGGAANSAEHGDCTPELFQALRRWHPETMTHFTSFTVLTLNRVQR